MKKSRFSESQIMYALKRVEAGLLVGDVCRELGISVATFYKWRAKFGGMETSLIARMKEHEEENRRLKKMAKRAVEEGGLSIRVVCQAFQVSQSCYRYEAKTGAENQEIANWLLKLTDKHRDWSFDLCFLYLRNVKRMGWSHKRVYRIYRELELNLRIKPRKRLVRNKP